MIYGIDNLLAEGTPVEIAPLEPVSYYELGGGLGRAMRRGGQVNGGRAASAEHSALPNAIHGDHLGTVSLTTDGGGSVVAEARYLPFGEQRWESGQGQTDFGFTGQRSEMDTLGLYFYKARWYDPALGRWAQPDSIVPDPWNPLDWDRYQYVRSNPLKYVDPSGFSPCFEDGYCPGDVYSVENHLSFYGVTLAGDWNRNGATNRNKWSVLFGVQAVGFKISEILWGISWGDTFKAVFRRGVEFYGGNDRAGLTAECAGIGSGACTSSSRLINVESMAGAAPNRSPYTAVKLNINNIVHELGHAFANLFISYKNGRQEIAPGSPYDFFGSAPGGTYKNERGYHPAPIGAGRMWVQNPTYTGNETFTHMYLGWTFGKWDSDEIGNVRNLFMLEYMPTQINLAAWR